MVLRRLNPGENYFDVILTDLDMPIMDGKTSTKLIREHERKYGWEHVKIIVQNL